MKKITLVCAVSFCFLCACSLVEYLFRGILTDQVLALCLGVGILVMSGVVAILSHKKLVFNILCFISNCFAMGFFIRAWYINRGFDNSYATMALVSLCAVAYLGVFFALSKLSFIRRSKTAFYLYFALFAAASAVGYLLVMLNTRTTFVSTFGYYMILELAFIFAMSFEVQTPTELFRNLTLSTYSVFLVALGVAVAVILALVCGDGADCDCDCSGCDCLGCDGDCCNTDGSKKKRKNNS